MRVASPRGLATFFFAYGSMLFVLWWSYIHKTQITAFERFFTYKYISYQLLNYRQLDGKFKKNNY